MSLANPLAVASFADLLDIEDPNFRPMWTQKASLSGGGSRRYADRAPMLWKADPQTVPMLHADAEKLMALINSRAGGLKTILLYNARLPYPSSDPDGSIWTTAAPTATVGTITDRLHVAFAGFPADYVVPVGTFFGIVFDTSRYYLGQFAEARTADGSGDVASVEIAPALPDSVAEGDAVTLMKPPAKFRIVPNSAYPTLVDPLYSRITFSAEQDYSQ